MRMVFTLYHVHSVLIAARACYGCRDVDMSLAGPSHGNGLGIDDVTITGKR